LSPIAVVCRELCFHSADPYVVDAYGKNALDYAKELRIGRLQNVLEIAQTRHHARGILFHVLAPMMTSSLIELVHVSHLKTREHASLTFPD